MKALVPTLAMVLSAAIAAPAPAETVVAARLIRAQSVITAEDLNVTPDDQPGGVARPDDLIGYEARVMIYPGRPVTLDQVGPPAVIERNQMVALLFVQGGLMIETEARALDRAGVGDEVRVMNMASKKTVTGRVRPDGSVQVGQD